MPRSEAPSRSALRRCARRCSALVGVAGGSAQAPANAAARSRPSPAAASGAWSSRTTSCPASSRRRPGYMGGKKRNPTYEEVSAGVTGHTEVVQVALRPDEGQLRKAARRVLAQHRSDGQGPPVLRQRQPVPHRDLRARRRAAEGRRGVEGGAREDASRSRNRSSRRSRRRPSSGRPRSTTRTTTRRIRCATSTTRPAAAARRG